MVGGFLEYNSMVLGFQWLYVLALVLFGLAFAASESFKRRDSHVKVWIG